MPGRLLAWMLATFGAVSAHAQASIALPGERVFPENIAASRDGTVYVGSVGQGGVFRIEPHGKEAQVWIKPGAFGTHSIFGVLADDKSNTLWVCSNDLSARGVTLSGSDGVSALKGFDLKTGEGKISAALPGKPATCNDITIGPDGSAFVSNTAAPQILRLAPGAKELEVWFTDPSLQPATGAGLDGLAFGRDGNLYVDRFTPGDLYRINVKNGKAAGATKLTPSQPLALTDAIRRIGKDEFLLVEGAGRLDRFTVQGDNVTVETLKDGYTTRPTGVAVAGKTAWVSEGQLSYLFDPDKKGQKPSLPFQISAVALPATPLKAPDATSAAGSGSACTGDGGGVVLSPGFCATVFADNIGHARHLVVAPNGVVYVNTWSGAYYKNDKPPAGGFLVALQDTKGTGKADVIKRFGDGVAQGSAGGTGIQLYKGAIYAEVNDRIVKYALDANAIVPAGKPEVIVSGMPLTGDHPMHPFIIDAQGNLLVDLGSATNACEVQNRMPKSPGNKPCTEKETRAGTWKYDANKTGQQFSPKERYATGIRNGEGFGIDADGRLFVTQHGRDQLSENWPDLYKPKAGPKLPAEEVVQLQSGADYGWPECYFDGVQKKLVLAPEYGGDGGKTAGLCAQRSPPAAFFPAHWAPNDLLFVTNSKFPAAYRKGAFIAFHGSWNRAPAPQGGYNVVFQPMAGGKAVGKYVVFADGFAGAVKEPGRAAARPSGLAAGPDGSLYISDDTHGRIWRVTYQGAPDAAQVAAAPAPKSPSASSRNAELPPEGVHPDAGRQTASASLTPPPGATKEQVALGDRIFHGEAAGGTCGGCHGSDGRGSPVGADLTSGPWLWSDGSFDGIVKTVTEGVPHPKQAGGAMPPFGGTPLKPDEAKAVAAYVYAISRGKTH
jgi:glucose/arabinose dehydrogenase/mono/diheme cytochrome c family protein